MIRQDWSTLKKLMFAKTAAGGEAAVEYTATGNPLTFQTDLAKPLKSLLIPFTPVQSGSGDPSPVNDRPIVPWEGLTVFGGGKNLFDTNTVYSDTSKFTINGNAVTGTASNFANTKLYIPSEFVGKKLTFSAKITTGADTTYLRTRANIGGTVTNGNQIESGTTGVSAVTFIPSADTDYIYFGFGSGQNGENVVAEIQLEVGQTATAYEPYAPITDTDISFPSPVYGGTLDVVSGVLTVEWSAVRADAYEWETSIVTSKGQTFMTTGSVSVPFAPWQNENGQAFAMSNAMIKNNFAGTFDDAPANSFWWNNGRSGYRCVFDQNASVQDLIQFFTDNDVIFCGKLATPQEITLTPEHITALKGENTIWSTGNSDLTAVYLVSGKYAEDHPVGGLSSGLGSGLLGSGTEDPDEPIEDPEENPEE